MKIYICIPSLNEAKSIRDITQLVDQGLQSLRSEHGQSIDAKIINIDSASDDGTADAFQQADTFFSKQSVILEKPRGKGKNLLEFIKIARAEGATHCLTIDADIRSAQSSWISGLLTPILTGQADFVTPLYARSRFEGSSTNHFAYPVVLATTGSNVRQPIAGDFAFSSALLDIIQEFEISHATQSYGIDIHLTLAALTRGLQHQQVALGEKTHNPSFNKLEYMFPQIAAAALSLLRQVEIREVQLQKREKTTINITQGLTFPHKDAARLMQMRALSRLSSENVKSWDWVPNKMLSKLEKPGQVDISHDDWVNILASWLWFGLNNKTMSADYLAEQLLPFFVIRATNFWISSEQLTAEEVERRIYKQAVTLYKLFQSKRFDEATR